ncbi:MAG: hypothetical protein RR540_04965 [Oscillospiraceae bacterium]
MWEDFRRPKAVGSSSSAEDGFTVFNSEPRAWSISYCGTTYFCRPRRRGLRACTLGESLRRPTLASWQ